MNSPDAGALHTLFAPKQFVDDHVFMTKSDEVGVLLQLDGIDAECLTDETLEDQHRRLLASDRPFDEQFTTYQYLVKLEGAEVEHGGNHANPIVRETVRSRLDFLASESGLASISLYRLVLYHPKRKKDVAKNTAFLMSRIRALMESVNDLLGATVLAKSETFRFFRLLASCDPGLASAERLRYNDGLDYWMAGTAIQCTADGSILDREVLSLRDLPRQTWANALADLLSIQGSFIVCSEYRKLHTEKVVSIINQKQQHFDAARWVKNIPALMQMLLSRGKTDWIVPDESAAEDVSDLSTTIKLVNNGGDAMGYYSLTAVFFDKSAAKAEAAATQAVKVFGDREGSLIRESYGALCAYLSIIPGTVPKQDFRLRRRLLPASQYVDLSFVYGHRKGEKVNRHLGQECLLVLQTSDKTPFYFNLHDFDVLDFLLFGAKGSGKSFTTNLIIDHLQKYRPFTFVFDIGGSYRQNARKHGGEYLALGERQRGWAPFALERTPSNLEFLSAFVQVLLEVSGYTATPQDCRQIDKAVLTAESLSDLEIAAHLKDNLYNWAGEGRFAHLFDNKKDSLDIASFQCFDFQGVPDKVLGPLVYYIFHRAFEICYDPKKLDRLKLFVADEVWKPLAKVPAAAMNFLEAGKTLRKHNGGIGLVTQSGLDLDRAGFLDAFLEACPNQLLLANPGGQRQFYQDRLGLNDREWERFTGLVPKRHVMLRTPQYSKVLEVRVDPLATAYYANDANSNLARIKAQAEFGLDEGLKRLAKGA